MRVVCRSRQSGESSVFGGGETHSCRANASAKVFRRRRRGANRGGRACATIRRRIYKAGKATWPSFPSDYPNLPTYIHTHHPLHYVPPTLGPLRFDFSPWSRHSTTPPPPPLAPCRTSRSPTSRGKNPTHRDSRTSPARLAGHRSPARTPRTSTLEVAPVRKAKSPFRTPSCRPSRVHLS